MFSKILEWFNTAPHVQSESVLRLRKAGKTKELIEAIEDERRIYQRTGKLGIGKSKCGKITVKRVGV